jgi:hypothetical protein
MKKKQEEVKPKASSKLNVIKLFSHFVPHRSFINLFYNFFYSHFSGLKKYFFYLSRTEEKNGKEYTTQ